MEVQLIVKPMQKREEPKTRINHQIRARQVRVVDENGEQLGIMDPRDAIREAEGRELDLVEVAPNASPPVCRIMDYGKYKYEQKRRVRESRKHQHTVSVKEIKYRPKIDTHDFDYKTNHVREFLDEGNKVKVTIMFRGREMAHPEFGRDILKKVVEATSDLITGEYSPENSRLEGRNMSLVLLPAKPAGSKKPKKSSAPKADEDAKEALMPVEEDPEKTPDAPKESVNESQPAGAALDSQVEAPKE